MRIIASFSIDNKNKPSRPDVVACPFWYRRGRVIIKE
jgi:hypothetical protein